MPSRLVALVAFDGVQAFDLIGPAEVYTTAARIVGPEDGYEVRLAAPDGRDVVTSAGIRLGVDRALADVGTPVDTVVVGGGFSAVDAAGDHRLVAEVRRLAAAAERTVSVCSGALILAAAGLLDGRRATTHWAFAEHLAAAHPQVTVEPDRIYIEDGPIWTSAGVSAGVDLALAMVERDHGPDLAREVARWLVVFLQRPGGQSQFNAPLWSARPRRDSLRELQGWVLAHPAADLSAGHLADRAHMSPRHFARVFVAQTGMTPARWVERVRVEAACRSLETTDAALDDVARACGLDTAATLHRAFRRVLGITPGDYRRRFRTTRPDQEAVQP